MELAREKVFRVVLLIGTGNSDMEKCFNEIQGSNITDSVVLVTDTSRARGFIVPGVDQVLYVAPHPGEWGSVFEFGHRMKDKNPELKIGWVCEDPYIRDPIDMIVRRKPGESFESLIDDIHRHLGHPGYAPFQTPELL